MAKLNLEQIVASASMLSTAAPVLVAAFMTLKTVWQAANPDKTEEDYLAYLQEQSAQNVAESAAILQSLGYVQTETGWQKP